MEIISINLTAIVLLLVANGFFVAAEFALVKSRGFRIEAYANEGSGAARLTLRIQGNLEAYLAACQLGITMASLGLGWVGEPAVAAFLEPLFSSLGVPERILHTTAFIVGFLLFSSLHIVIGEQVPKTFAIRKAEPVSMWVAYPLHAAYLLTFPLNWALNYASRAILNIFEVEEATHAEVYSGEELKGFVSTAKAHGGIEENKADMLHNLFEFDQRHIGRVMIPRASVKTLDLNGNPNDNLRIIQESGHSRFPVVDSANDDAIVGVVLANDLFTAMLRGEKDPWQELQQHSRKPLVVPESQKVATLFDNMRAQRAHMAFVVDEYGGMAGIVTLEDLLEEIVGDIHDETDTQEAEHPIIQIDENHWEADGLSSLTDIERVIRMKVADELDANTLSGLFMVRLGRMPEIGDTIDEDGFRLTVQLVDDRRVGRVLLEKSAEEHAEATSSHSKDKPKPNGASKSEDHVT